MRKQICIPPVCAISRKPVVYAYTREATRRNLYRIQLP